MLAEVLCQLPTALRKRHEMSKTDSKVSYRVLWELNRFPIFKKKHLYELVHHQNSLQGNMPISFQAP